MLNAMIVLLALAAPAVEVQPAFRAARPIWPQGRETVMNLTVGFRAVIEPPAGLRWTMTDGKLHYHIDAPAGYEIETAADDPTRIVRQP